MKMSSYDTRLAFALFVLFALAILTGVLHYFAMSACESRQCTDRRTPAIVGGQCMCVEKPLPR